MDYLLKKQDRKVSKYDMIFRLIFIVLSFGISFLVYWLTPADGNLLFFISRLGLLVLGVGNLIFIYKQDWSIRNVIDYKEDSILIEGIYMGSMALLASIAYVAAPFTFDLVPYSSEVALSLWDAPIIYLLPFFVLKMLDGVGQIPLKAIESPWLFPIEKVSPETWKWRNLLQVNFKLKSSLLEEYDMFTWYARPWIEAPIETELGKVFHLCIQERRKKSDLLTIQDMGDEYDGQAQFCWMFYLGPAWYKPKSWFVNSRVLNPFVSIEQNQLSADDVIFAKRIVGDGKSHMAGLYDDMPEDDSEKTVFINR
jgi:hypothetical protein